MKFVFTYSTRRVNQIVSLVTSQHGFKVRFWHALVMMVTKQEHYYGLHRQPSREGRDCLLAYQRQGADWKTLKKSSASAELESASAALNSRRKVLEIHQMLGSGWRRSQ